MVLEFSRIQVVAELEVGVDAVEIGVRDLYAVLDILEGLVV